ncbi:hypothetical protein ACFYYH_23975 [Streptomyces sp. NPDC002018]|uniref:hypothetical protein n=1 Tax=Streptomyces sp. NPDC002018 TaxID=3364629 RepID=UPI0036BB187C
MSADDGADVPLGSLRLLDRIGDGGQGEVYTLGGWSGVLYKSYREPRRVDGDALAALVAVRRALEPGDRDRLDAEAAWPLCRVTDGGQVTGFLMHRAPSTMMWRASNGDTKLTELAFLLRPPKRAWQEVVQPSPGERYDLVVALVELLDRLHTMGLVLGDLSQANVLWTVRPGPAVYLLDCDGARPAGREPVLAQADTIDWNDPKAPPGLVTVDSDRYKAALALARILAQDAYAAPGKPFVPLPGVLDERREAAVRRLLGQAAGDFGTRPDLGQWRTALAGRDVIKLTAATPAPRPMVDRSKFDEIRQRGTISLRD